MSNITKSNYKETVEFLNRANDAYYKDSRPIMSDAEFDLLLDQLQEFEDENPELISKDSPTQKVGSDNLGNFEKVQHKFPMLSIGKINEFSEVEKYVRETNEKTNRTNFYLSQLKIDGCSLALVYIDGILERAITRGNGSVGDDVTKNALTVESIPKKIKTDQPRVEVRGECVIFKENFKSINDNLKARNEKTYENARNLVSGSMKLKDNKEISKRKINFIAYSLVEGGTSSQWDDMLQLKNWGFETPDGTAITGDVDSINEYLRMVDGEKTTYKYDIDGVVIKLDDKTFYQIVGGTSKVPHWCKAFKFKPEAAVTTLRDVEMQIGRTGVCCPVGIFDPVRLAGTTVTKATLHNFDEINRLGICIGDQVYLEKKGEIIPKCVGLAKVGENRTPILPPEFCPACEVGKVEQVNGEVVYKCMNPDCSAKILGKFKHFSSKFGMDLYGISEALLEDLINLELVSDFADLYDLTEEILVAKVPRMGKRKAENTINAIQTSKNRGLVKLLISLGIPNCGENTCKNLANEFKSIDVMLETPFEKYLEIPDIGSTTARSIFYYFASDENARLIERLKERGIKMDIEKVEVKGSVLAGKTFVITGTLENKRDFYVDLIEKNGGKVSGSVSKNTSFLLAGLDCGSKLDKAEKLGVVVLDEPTFLGMI